MSEDDKPPLVIDLGSGMVKAVFADEVAAMSEEDKPPLVIDLGSGMVKAGFAGEEEPCSVFPSIVGSPLPKMEGRSRKDTYVGREAKYKRHLLTLREPVKHGIVTDWEDVERIMDHVFEEELKVKPQDHAVLVTEPPLNPKSNREKMTEMMFEKYDTPGMFMAIQGVLSLYESDRTTGIVLDSGHGVTHIVPVYEGFAIEQAIHRMEFAGGDLTNFLIKLLSERGHDFTTTAERMIVGDMKEQLCYVAADFEAELSEVTGSSSSEKQTTFSLREGQSLTLDRERFMCPEVLFNPSLYGQEMKAIPTALHDAIQRCEVDVRSALYSNIVLSGGSTMFPGLPARLQGELEVLAPTARRIKIVAPSRRSFSVWKGGSILANLITFQNMLIRKEEYEETGAAIVHRKCF